MLWLRRVAFAAVIGGFAAPATADTMTAGSVLERMEGDAQVTFMAGIVEGLATARFYDDGRETTGQSCIYNWFYRTEGTMRSILAAFERFPNELPGPIMAVLVREQCGG